MCVCVWGGVVCGWFLGCSCFGSRSQSVWIIKLIIPATGLYSDTVAFISIARCRREHTPSDAHTHTLSDAHTHTHTHTHTRTHTHTHTHTQRETDRQTRTHNHSQTHTHTHTHTHTLSDTRTHTHTHTHTHTSAFCLKYLTCSFTSIIVTFTWAAGFFSDSVLHDTSRSGHAFLYFNHSFIDLFISIKYTCVLTYLQ